MHTQPMQQDRVLARRLKHKARASQIPLLHVRCLPSGSEQQCQAEPTTGSHAYPTLPISRRQILIAAPTVASAAIGMEVLQPPVASALQADPQEKAACLEQLQPFLSSPIDYTQAGPMTVNYLPKLETVCTSCFSSCAGTNCLLRVSVAYPSSGGIALGLGPPYPLAIITPGFLVAADSYKSYAERLASWGYCVVLYDKVETMNNSLDDVTSVTALRHLMSWAATHPLVGRLTNATQVYLVGHSRGGKLSALAAATQDPRVHAVCLLDPVDNTIYAPLSPTYPSAVAALRGQASRGYGRALTASERSLDTTSQPLYDPQGSFLAPSAAQPTSLYAQPGLLRQAEALAFAEQAPLPPVQAPLQCQLPSEQPGQQLQQQQGFRTSGTQQSNNFGAAAGVTNQGVSQLQGNAVPGEDDDDDDELSQQGACIPGSAAGSNQQGFSAAAVPKVPIAIIGVGFGGDCAPRDANFRQFYEAAQGPTWEVAISEAGHFQFLDELSPIQRAVCPAGSVPDSIVHDISLAAMVAWAEVNLRKRSPALLAGATPAAPLYPDACERVPPRPATQVARKPLRIPSFWASVEEALGIGMNGAAAARAIAGPIPAVLERPVPPAQTVTSVDITPAEPVVDNDPDALAIALDRLMTRLRYQSQVLQVETRYKNLEGLSVNG